MADSTYELRPWRRVASLVALAVFLLVVLVVIPLVYEPGPDVEAAEAAVSTVLLAGVFGSVFGYEAFYWPYRVMLSESDVTLTARARQIVIPWNELVSVEERGVGRHRRVKWRRTSGRAINTSPVLGVPHGRLVVDLQPMLTEIKHRAPHVRVRRVRHW